MTSTAHRRLFTIFDQAVSVRTAKSHSRPDRQPDAGYCRLAPEELTGPEPLYITAEVIAQIRATVGAMPAEQGGILGGRRVAGLVTDYHFDTSAARTSTTYTPEVELLNTLLREEWNPAGIDFLGVVHSHPAGFSRPSGGDHVYAQRILEALPQLDRLLMPIVQTQPDTRRFQLHPFIASRSHAGVQVEAVPLVTMDTKDQAPTMSDPAFDRVLNSYDLTATDSTRLVLVGVGGAAAFAESIARAGIGEFVLIDPDTIDLPNIGTQQVYRRDVGRPKIDALAERILDVNPHARVVGIQHYLEDLDDDMIRRLVHRPLPNSRSRVPHTTILCGFTDNFWAQARVNRLALHLGVPMVAAQVYQHGHGVELSFHVPGHSTACGRCVLGSRYRAHLDQHYTNTVTSHGTPLWATERLNELKTQVILAILHGTTPTTDPDNPGGQRYRNLLEQIATRNLVQVRLAPEANLPAVTRALASADADRVITDDTVWLPQQPENPDTGFEHCADCGGTGELRDRIGTFTETRLSPPTTTDDPTTTAKEPNP